MYLPKPKKLPSGSWHVNLRLGGENCSITEPTEADCRRRAQLVKAEYLAGRKEKRRPEATMTLRQGIETYVGDRSNSLSPSTARKYENIKNNHWPELMDRRMDQITPRQWQQAVNAALGAYATKTVKVSWGMTKTVLTACGLVAPPVSIGKASETKALEMDKTKFLEPEQILKFVEASKGSPQTIPLLLALSSLRIAEIDGLLWSDVVPAPAASLPSRSVGAGVLDGPLPSPSGEGGPRSGPDEGPPPQTYLVKIRRVRIQDKDGNWLLKTGAKNETSVRDVSIQIPALNEAIAAARTKIGRQDEKLMTCCQETLRRECSRTCERAGVPNPGVHGLRHSFASLSAHLGVPELVSQQIGGWANDKIMKEIYTHVAQADLQSTQQKFAAFYARKPEQKPDQKPAQKQAPETNNAHEYAHTTAET